MKRQKALWNARGKPRTKADTSKAAERFTKRISSKTGPSKEMFSGRGKFRGKKPTMPTAADAKNVSKADWVKRGKIGAIGAGSALAVYGGYRMYKKHKEKKQKSGNK